MNGVLMEDTETKQKPPAAPVVNPISMVSTASVRVPMGTVPGAQWVPM